MTHQHARFQSFNPIHDSVAVGRWTRTASIDWCESNYSITEHIAEFYNTLTNLLFFFLSILGIHNALSQELGKRYLLSYIGLLTVGLGSFLFHATLIYGFQLMDEIPMLYVTTLLLYVSLETAHKGQPSRGGLLLPVGLFALVSTITAIYCFYNDAVFHQVSYATLLVTVAARCTYLTRTRLNMTPFESQRKKLIQYYMRLGIFFALLSFLVWNIDNQFCLELQSWKKALGPLAPCLEGHALWHLGTGIGSYYLIFAFHLLSLSIREDAEAFKVRKRFGLPYIIRVKSVKTR